MSIVFHTYYLLSVKAISIENGDPLVGKNGFLFVFPTRLVETVGGLLPPSPPPPLRELVLLS